jgi:carboxyl-terminal processing protease
MRERVVPAFQSASSSLVERRPNRSNRLVAMLTLAALTALPGLSLAQQQVELPKPGVRVAAAEARPAPARASATVSRWGQQVWDAAQRGSVVELQRLLESGRDGGIAGLSDDTKASLSSYLNNLNEREKARGMQSDESRKELDRLLALEHTPSNVLKCLREVLELHSLSRNKDALLVEPPIADLLTRAEAMARECEAKGEILDATELFVYLNEFNDISAKFRPDVRRLALRQEMMRLYVPERLWEMANQRRLRNGDKALPPFNSLGTDYRDRLANVTQETVERALARARDHVEQVSVNQIVLSGLDALRTFLTTDDLKGAFEGLGDVEKRRELLAQIDVEKRALSQMAVQLDVFQVGGILDRVQAKNQTTVNVPAAALVHEFGNGAMSKLDEYSQIIWPDELARFKKTTEGRFVGVGVQIEFNDLGEVRVVTPLEGSPAQRSGVHPDDVITKVDGKSIFGLGLDQVVDQITGREGTQVVVTVERPIVDNVHSDDPPVVEGAPAKPTRKEIEFRFTRATIDVPSVRGWKRSGAREDSWEWFLDQPNGIGYLRLSSFADTSTQEIDRAVAQMKRKGLNALIFDLRYNPGGLLDQAVTIAQRFLPFDNEPIVSARRAGGAEEVDGWTSKERATLDGIPVVVLVNEGSASASEIVSGALRVYSSSDKHQADVIVLGNRTYGKGSVQNVWPLNAHSLMKLTTAYYMIPDGSIIHRRPGKTTWGVEPHLKVEMLPKQSGDAIMLRRNADVLPLDENGVSLRKANLPNPDDLITKGIDLQLEAAKVLLLSRVAGGPVTAGK